MNDKTTNRGGGRWLTAGSARLYAVLLFCGALWVFYCLLGCEDLALVWIPALASVVLSAPLYLFLRAGDRRIQRWWARRQPRTRLLLRRVGRGVEAAALSGLAIVLLSGEAGRRGPEGVQVGAGVLLLLTAGFHLLQAVREGERSD